MVLCPSVVVWSVLGSLFCLSGSVSAGLIFEKQGDFFCFFGWLCKLFDKALVCVLACGALVMCLQMR